jgi:hypothetical protein
VAAGAGAGGRCRRAAARHRFVRGRVETGWEERRGRVGGGIKIFVGPVVGIKGKLKDDECKRGKYVGENLDDQDNIFCFEGGNEVTPVWMVLDYPHLFSFIFSFKREYSIILINSLTFIHSSRTRLPSYFSFIPTTHSWGPHISLTPSITHLPLPSSHRFSPAPLLLLPAPLLLSSPPAHRSGDPQPARGQVATVVARGGSGWRSQGPRRGGACPHPPPPALPLPPPSLRRRSSSTSRRWREGASALVGWRCEGAMRAQRQRGAEVGAAMAGSRAGVATLTCACRTRIHVGEEMKLAPTP